MTSAEGEGTPRADDTHIVMISFLTVTMGVKKAQKFCMRHMYKAPELEAGEDLAVVDVGAGGALVVVVLEVLGRQPRVTVVGAVQAETDLDRAETHC